MTLSLWSPSLHAEGEAFEKLEVVETIGKKVYLNARVIGTNDAGVRVAHDAEISLIAYKNLPPELALKYGAGAPSQDADGGSAPMARGGEQMGGSTAGKSISSFDPASLVFITMGGPGGGGLGSGFIVRSGTKAYVYTNAHVLCGSDLFANNRIISVVTGTGRTIPIPYELELSMHYNPQLPYGLEDMARFEILLKEGDTAYEIGAPAVQDYMGQKVVAYGNSLGGGVLTALEGNVLGVGLDQIEISCEIMPGNSGGPVVIKGTNQVIGISTYAVSGLINWQTIGTDFIKARRFALRLEQGTKWRKMQLTSFFTAMNEITTFNAGTISLLVARHLRSKDNVGGFETPDENVKKLLIAGAKNPVGAAIYNGVAKVNQRLGAVKGRISMNTYLPIFNEFHSSVLRVSASEIQSAQQSDRAAFIKKRWEQNIVERKFAHELFVKWNNFSE